MLNGFSIIRFRNSSIPQLALRCGRPRVEHVSAHRIEDTRDIGVLAAIDGAGGERFRPHLFIRNAMSADDLRLAELGTKVRDILEVGQLQVNDGDLSPVFRNCVSDFIHRPRDGDGAEVSV